MNTNILYRILNLINLQNKNYTKQPHHVHEFNLNANSLY